MSESNVWVLFFCSNLRAPKLCCFLWHTCDRKQSLPTEKGGETQPSGLALA